MALPCRDPDSALPWFGEPELRIIFFVWASGSSRAFILPGFLARGLLGLGQT